MRINEDGNGRAHVCPADIRDEDTVEALFDQVEATHGPIKAAVLNTGAQHRQPFLDIPADSFEKVWRLGCYAGFLVGRAAARRMVPRNKGSALSPEAIGQAYVDLHHQQRSAWSFEIDLRPWSEKF